TEMHDEFGRGAIADRAASSAVEQAHGGFDDQEIGVFGGFMSDGVEERRTHCPAVEIETRRLGGGGMERRIDIIRAAFGSAHAQSTPPEGRKQRERHRGFAGTRARRGDDNRLRFLPHHAASETPGAGPGSFACGKALLRFPWTKPAICAEAGPPAPALPPRPSLRTRRC